MIVSNVMSNFLSCLCLQLHCMKSYHVKRYPDAWLFSGHAKTMAASKNAVNICWSCKMWAFMELNRFPWFQIRPRFWIGCKYLRASYIFYLPTFERKCIYIKPLLREINILASYLITRMSYVGYGIKEHNQYLKKSVS